MVFTGNLLKNELERINLSSSFFSSQHHTSNIPIPRHIPHILCLEEAETPLVGDIQVRQGDAGIQAASFFTAPDMDGVALVGEVPGLAVDGRRSQTGRFQTGIRGVSDLGQGLALEALQIVAELVALGMAEGEQDDELHALHMGGGFGVHPAHAEPAHAQTQGLQVQIHLLEQEADVFQIPLHFLGVNGDELGRGPGADALDLVPAHDVYADLDIRVQGLHLKGQDLFDGFRIHRLAQETPAGSAMVDHFVQGHGFTSHSYSNLVFQTSFRYIVPASDVVVFQQFLVFLNQFQEYTR